MQIQIADLAVMTSRYELPEIKTANDDTFGPPRFVLEVLRRPVNGPYEPRLLHRKYAAVDVAYVAPVEGASTRTICEVVVVDDSFDWSKLASATAQETVERVMAQTNKLIALDP
jgi:hypothetical protein